MAINFLEAGTDATFGTEFYTSLAGNITSSTAQAHTGTHALSAVTDGAGGAARAEKDSVLNGATGGGNSATFYLYYNEAISAANQFLFVGDTGNGVAFYLGTDNTGLLQIYDSTTTAKKSGVTTISNGVWTRIAFATTESFPNFTVKVWVNGTLQFTATQADFTINAHFTNIKLMAQAVGNSKTVYFDDIYIDDNSGLTDPGDIRVTAKLPASTNTGNFGTTVGTGAVNERPLSETNGVEDTGSAGDQQNYTLQAASVGDVDVSTATLVARCAWIWSKISSASVAAKIMDNGSESAVTLTTTSALYTLLTASASYPSNAAGIGMRSSTTPNTFLYECGTLIAYTPLTDSSTTQQRMVAVQSEIESSGSLGLRWI